MGFSRQGYWSGLPLPSLEALPDPGIEPPSPALQADSLPMSHWGSPHKRYRDIEKYWRATLMTPGEGNGKPFQYPGLGNPMDRGAWWATVHGVAKSHTWLSDWAHSWLEVKNAHSKGFNEHGWDITGLNGFTRSLLCSWVLDLIFCPRDWRDLGWGKLFFVQNTQHILLHEPALECRIKMSSSCVCQLGTQVQASPWAPQTWKAWGCFSQYHSALGPLILGMAPWTAAAEPGGGGIHWGTQRWVPPPTPVGDQGSLGGLSSVDPEEGKFLAMVSFGINGHELEQTLGHSGGQGSLVWCSPWGCKEVEQLSNGTTTTICNINTRCQHLERSSDWGSVEWCVKIFMDKHRYRYSENLLVFFLVLDFVKTAQCFMSSKVRRYWVLIDNTCVLSVLVSKCCCNTRPQGWWLRIIGTETSLVIQRLRPCTRNAGGLGLISGQGTRCHTPQLRIPHVLQLSHRHR